MPIAHAGPDIQVPSAGGSTTVLLDGSASHDPDGVLVAYRWSLLSGPLPAIIVSPTAVQTLVTGLQVGLYQFELAVTDNAGATARDAIFVTVQSVPNDGPVADAGPDQQLQRSGPQPATAVLDGSGSFDPDGALVAYAWSLVAGPAGATIITPGSAQTVVSGLQTGLHVFKLMVTDNRGVSAADTALVAVVDAAPPAGGPTARAGRDLLVVFPATSAVLDGSASSSAGGAVVRFQWDQVDGPAAGCASGHDTARLSLSRLARGSYRYRLTVTDDQGRRNSDEVNVTVRRPELAK